jgi:hypothetical protein
MAKEQKLWNKEGCAPCMCVWRGMGGVLIVSEYINSKLQILSENFPQLGTTASQRHSLHKKPSDKNPGFKFPSFGDLGIALPPSES